METAEITFLSDELVKCESPSSCTTESGLTSQGKTLDLSLSSYKHINFHRTVNNKHKI